MVHGSAETAFVGDPVKSASLTIFVGLSYVLLGDPDGGLISLTLPGLQLLANPSMETLSAQLSGGGRVALWHRSRFVLDLDGGQIVFSAIPEPSSVCLLAIGGGAIACRRRPKRC